ncbi:MAG: phospholipid methyltransferase, partial [Hydrogenophaga sp.]|nr:phospholipid methyltransferase [Hydrogenophaga sp.]
MDHGLAFALGCLRNPRRVGAIAPASRALAQAVCDEALRGAPGVLIEVGAGTGALTRRLATAARALAR